MYMLHVLIFIVLLYALLRTDPYLPIFYLFHTSFRHGITNKKVLIRKL